jgi:integrase
MPIQVGVHDDIDIVNYALWLARNGYSPETVKERAHKIRMISRRVGTLLDGEAVKDYVARSQYKGSTKRGIFTSYASYAKFKGFTFAIPRVTLEDTIPFIPLEAEIDCLISASGRKLGTFLLMLKETGARTGELMREEWADLDPDTGVLNIRPEKRGRARQVKLSNRLLSMVSRLPKKNGYIFAKSRTGSLRNNLDNVRARLADRLQNPRLLRISFHSFRHWYATKTYWSTKDILFTQKALGHRSLQSTLKYTQLVNWAQENNFHAKAVTTTTEAEGLIAQGWQYVATSPEGAMLFRKPK